MSSERRHFATEEEFAEFRAKIHERYIWTFGEWSFDWIDRIVQPGGIYLDPRTADILRVLCESLSLPLSAGAIRNEVAAINGGAHLKPDSIKVLVFRLRKLIGPERVCSIDKRGYLFVPFPPNGNSGERAE